MRVTDNGRQGELTTMVEAQATSAVEVPERWRLGPAFVPKSRYVDPQFAELEREKLFPRTWLNACRVDEVERVGDYVDFEIGDQSIVIVRTEGGLRAYFNACRHRGTRLVSGQGRIGEFRCPFHAWRWHLDGSLKYQADEENFDPRPANELCLPECRVDTWGGWVFINMDANAEPLLDFLDPLPTRLADFKLEEMRIAWYKRVILPANWKTALDAFIESWHVPGTHPQLLRADKQGSPATIAEAQSYSKMYNELFRYHSRHADFARYGDEGNPSGLRAQFGATAQSIFTNVTYNLRELRALYLKTDLLAAGELLASDDPDGPGAGPRYTELRKKHARAAGIDIPELSADQLRVAMFDWHMFPNSVFLLDMGCAIAYRSRPNGLDPDTCIFDVQGLELPPASGIDTARPEYFDDWRQGDMGAVLNQDFANMSEVTVGLHSRQFDGYRLNRLQEMTIWNYQRALDGFLFDQG